MPVSCYCVSYLTTTLVVEAMGVANAVLKKRGPKRSIGLTSEEVTEFCFSYPTSVIKLCYSCAKVDKWGCYAQTK